MSWQFSWFTEWERLLHWVLEEWWEVSSAQGLCKAEWSSGKDTGFGLDWPGVNPDFVASHH